MRNGLAIAFACLFGFSLLWVGSDGYKAFTADTATRLEIKKNPRKVPNVTLEDQAGNYFKLQDFKGKVVLTTFMYVSCHDLCPTLEMKFNEIFNRLPAKYLGEEILLVSISFDTQRDSAKLLADHAIRFGAEGKKWRVARIAEQEKYAEFLNTFEVIVIPNEFGGFEHNGGFHLIDRNGNLVDIFYYENVEEVVEETLKLVKNT